MNLQQQQYLKALVDGRLNEVRWIKNDSIARQVVSITEKFNYGGAKIEPGLCANFTDYGYISLETAELSDFATFQRLDEVFNSPWQTFEDEPEEEEDEDEIESQYIPKTIKEGVEYLYKTIAPEDKEYVKNQSPNSIHFSSGMALRNGWKLWEKDTPIKLDAVKNYGIAHADDITGLVYAWLWAMVREEPFDPIKHCEKYHEHWKRYGTTSLEAGGY